MGFVANLEILLRKTMKLAAEKFVITSDVIGIRSQVIPITCRQIGKMSMLSEKTSCVSLSCSTRKVFRF